MVCVLGFIYNLLLVKQFKYEGLDGSKSASHRFRAVDWFCHNSYQSIVMIFRTISRGMGIALPATDTDVIFDNDWNTHLRNNIYPL